ncbi:ulp-1, partial [Pristionchus pacificus]
KVTDLLSPVALSILRLPEDMSEAQLAAPLRVQADTQRKRVQLDTSGGPPAKKSIVTKAWWALKSLMPWSRSESDEDGRVVTVNEEEEEREDGDDDVIEEDEEGEEVQVLEEEEEEQEDEEEVEVVEEDDDDEDIVALPLLGGQPPSLHRLICTGVPEVVTMGGSTDEEEHVIRREVREEEVLIVETPDKTTLYKRTISPLPAAPPAAPPAPVVTLDSANDSDDEIVEVPQVASTPSCSSSRVFSTTSSFSHAHPTLTGLSPEVTTRVMEYVTEQSSRVVTAHSPSQSSTASYDRERLRVEEEEGRGDSPLPEDSASRQVTPKSAIGGTERSAYGGPKRDTWRKNNKRDRDPFRLVGRSRVIGKDTTSLTKKTTERLRMMNNQRHGEKNPFDDEAKQRYKQIIDEIAKGNAMGNGRLVMKEQATLPFTFITPDLNTRQKLGLEDHKKRLAVGTKMALNVLDDMFPRRRGVETIQVEGRETVDREVAGPSRDTTITLDESPSRADYSIRSPNVSSLSFHSVDKLSDLQSKIQEMKLISTCGKLQYDIYKGSKADFDRTVERLGEEGDLRTAHRLEVERLHHIDVRTKLALQGIVIPEPEKVIDEFPDLSDEAEALWRRAWVRGVETEKFRDGDPPLTRKDLQTLYGANWLNDEVILAYMNLIVDRSKADKNLPSTYAFNTFFYGNISNPSKGFATVKRWTRKVDIFSYDILLIPVHLSVHWTMAVVDVPAKSIHFYDSMDGKGGHREVAEKILNYLVAESMDKRKISLDVSEWERVSRTDIPQQQNGSDCGVFACKFADFAARRMDIPFDQSHMPYYRKRMVYQLCQNDLAAF